MQSPHLASASVQNLLEKQILRPHTKLAKSETLWLGPRMGAVTSPPGDSGTGSSWRPLVSPSSLYARLPGVQIKAHHRLLLTDKTDKPTQSLGHLIFFSHQRKQSNAGMKKLLLSAKSH